MAEWEIFCSRNIYSHTSLRTWVRISKSPKKKRLWNKSIKKKEKIRGSSIKSPCSSAAERLQHRRLLNKTWKVRIWRWLSPYKRKVTGSKPVGDIHYITSHRCIKALEQPLNRHGAEEARGAHNSDVTRSKRVAGIHKGNLRFPFDPSLQIGQGVRGDSMSPTSHRIGASRH